MIYLLTFVVIIFIPFLFEYKTDKKEHMLNRRYTIYFPSFYTIYVHVTIYRLYETLLSDSQIKKNIFYTDNKLVNRKRNKMY